MAPRKGMHRKPDGHAGLPQISQNALRRGADEGRD